MPVLCHISELGVSFLASKVVDISCGCTIGVSYNMYEESEITKQMIFPSSIFFLHFLLLIFHLFLLLLLGEWLIRGPGLMLREGCS